MIYKFMRKNHKIAAIVLTIIIVPTVLLVFYSLRIKNYRAGFKFVEINQFRQTVINLMGEASEIRKCDFPIYDGNERYFGKCVEIFIYQGIYEKWAIAFDENGNVIEKYNWFLGEYGKRPPDIN